MSDDPVRTMVETEGGELAFQDYFVRLACAVPVKALRYAGAEKAALNPALACVAEIAAVMICPSNPYLSIDPILAVAGMRDWIASRSAPVVAVSPIVAGAAIKGPAAKIMGELGMPATAAAIARHYAGLIDGLVIDEADAALADEVAAAGVTPRVAPTVMRSIDDRVALARTCLAFARELAEGPCR
jgi:LPPG:FO 2-phospho-L-lactate transferase